MMMAWPLSSCYIFFFHHLLLYGIFWLDFCLSLSLSVLVFKLVIYPSTSRNVFNNNHIVKFIQKKMRFFYDFKTNECIAHVWWVKTSDNDDSNWKSLNFNGDSMINLFFWLILHIFFGLHLLFFLIWIIISKTKFKLIGIEKLANKKWKKKLKQSIFVLVSCL